MSNNKLYTINDLVEWTDTSWDSMRDIWLRELAKKLESALISKYNWEDGNVSVSTISSSKDVSGSILIYLRGFNNLQTIDLKAFFLYDGEIGFTSEYNLFRQLVPRDTLLIDVVPTLMDLCDQALQDRVKRYGVPL